VFAIALAVVLSVSFVSFVIAALRAATLVTVPAPAVSIFVFLALAFALADFGNLLQPLCVSGCAQVASLALLFFAHALALGALKKFARRRNALAEIRHALVCKALEHGELGLRDRAHGLRVLGFQVCSGARAALRARTRLCSSPSPPSSVPAVCHPCALFLFGCGCGCGCGYGCGYVCLCWRARVWSFGFWFA